MSHSRNEERGASSVEYGLIVFAIAALITIAVFALGGVNKELFSNSCDEIRTEWNKNGGSAPTCS